MWWWVLTLKHITRIPRMLLIHRIADVDVFGRSGIPSYEVNASRTKSGCMLSVWNACLSDDFWLTRMSLRNSNEVIISDVLAKVATRNLSYRSLGTNTSLAINEMFHKHWFAELCWTMTISLNKWDSGVFLVLICWFCVCVWCVNIGNIHVFYLKLVRGKHSRRTRLSCLAKVPFSHSLWWQPRTGVPVQISIWIEFVCSFAVYDN